MAAAIRLSAIHTDDSGTTRDLRWRRDEQHQETVFIQEAQDWPASPYRFWTLVIGLEAGHRVWASCAGCGVMGELLIDPLTPGLQWCRGCGGGRSPVTTPRPRRPVRAVPDPRPEPHEDFYPMQMRVVLGGEPMTLTICHVCAAVVPGGDRSKARHLQWHQLLQEAVDAGLPR